MVWKVAPAIAALVVTAACGGTDPAGTEATGPRVYFIQPEDGATVTSPVTLEFGAQEFRIAAVPAGTVTESRPDLGHHHVGIDTECLPVGTPIPMAAPWVHFGDGKNVIDMQLPPGEHTLTLQIGDDLHRTMEGLCETITVTVTP
jgi:hypothetical protein